MQQYPTYPAQPRSRGLALGLAVSVLLHIALLALWRAPSMPSLPAQERQWTQPLSVRLLPPAPPPALPRAEPPKPAEKPARRPIPKAAPAQPAAAPDDRPAMTAAPTVHPTAPTDPAPAPDPLAVDTNPDAPSFDPDAARAAAGKAAKDTTPPPANWVAAKLNKDKEWKETMEQRLGRNIANSARPDCKTAYAGLGIFAPLKMMLDKKGSGCKF